jgi:hypothetical protein
MKLIYSNTLLSISLTSGTANADFPLANVLNEYPRKPCILTANSGTFTIIESGAAKALALFATNAISGSAVSVVGYSLVMGSDECGYTILLGYDENAETITLDDSGDRPETIHSSFTVVGKTGSLWIDFESQGYCRTIHITLTAPDNEMLEVGVIAVGEVMEFRDLLNSSYQENPVDYSVEQELQSGNPYYKDLGRAREINGMTIMHIKDQTDPDGYATWWNFYYDFVRIYGKKPTAWMLSSTIGMPELYVWARLQDMVKTAMFTPAKTLVSLILREIN